MSTAPTHRPPDTLRSIYYALGANLGITVVKFGGAAFTGSGTAPRCRRVHAASAADEPQRAQAPERRSIDFLPYYA